MQDEKLINIESVRIPVVRDNYGILSDLGASIADEGLRHPITVWSDGTLISGSRRLRAMLLLGGKHKRTQAVFVDTIEDAAKRLLADNADEHHARPMKPTEIINLWTVLRHLDEPAAAHRRAAARRRGIELRRQTMAGKRPPGRTRGVSESYFLTVLGEPFGMSEATAARLWMLHKIATTPGDEDRRAAARQALANLDSGTSSVWAEYARLTSGRAPLVSKPKAEKTTGPEPASKQTAAWARALPNLEGLVAGLTELGPPNPELTWDQVGPVRARLVAARRDLEKIINKMKENNPT